MKTKMTEKCKKKGKTEGSGHMVWGMNSKGYWYRGSRPEAIYLSSSEVNVARTRKHCWMSGHCNAKSYEDRWRQGTRTDHHKLCTWTLDPVWTNTYGVKVNIWWIFITIFGENLPIFNVCISDVFNMPVLKFEFRSVSVKICTRDDYFVKF